LKINDCGDVFKNYDEYLKRPANSRFKIKEELAKTTNPAKPVKQLGHDLNHRV
jgi:hypothetical protein